MCIDKVGWGQAWPGESNKNQQPIQAVIASTAAQKMKTKKARERTDARARILMNLSPTKCRQCTAVRRWQKSWQKPVHRTAGDGFSSAACSASCSLDHLAAFHRYRRSTSRWRSCSGVIRFGEPCLLSSPKARCVVPDESAYPSAAKR